MRYYDTIETPKTGRIFLEDGENRLPETDDRVKNWFIPKPEGKQRAFSVEGYPIFEDVSQPTQEELDAIAKAEADTAKKEALENLIITIPSGKRFYADAESRTDILTAVLEIMELGIPDEYEIDWKTPDGLLKVSALEMKQAKRIALEEKGRIIGVAN